MCTLSYFSCVWLFVTPWTVAHQAPLSMGFSRQEYRSGLPCPYPGDLLDPGIGPLSLMTSNDLISVIPFSSWLQSFSASESFPMSQSFASGGQSIETSALASVLPMNIQGWFPLGLTLQFKGLSRVFSTTTVQKYQFFSPQPSYICTWLWEKPQPWLGGLLLAKRCLCFLIHCLGLS